MLNNNRFITTLAVLTVIAALIGSVWLKDYECSCKAKKQGMEYSWGLIQGCVIREQGGNWIDRLRMEDK